MALRMCFLLSFFCYYHLRHFPFHHRNHRHQCQWYRHVMIFESIVVAIVSLHFQALRSENVRKKFKKKQKPNLQD